MAQAKQGDKVSVHYTGTLQNGVVFDSSKMRHPIQFTIGEGKVIAGFEQAVVGMKAGESKTVLVPVEQGYGPRRDELIISINRSQLPGDVNPQAGQRLELTQENDQTMLVTVQSVTEDKITLDANHPLAGKELTFVIELVAVG